MEWNEGGNSYYKMWLKILELWELCQWRASRTDVYDRQRLCPKWVCRIKNLNVSEMGLSLLLLWTFIIFTFESKLILHCLCIASE